tara:strand:- start:47 stop:361 length:315 start_codon:yes stop_codon:yes gene_type:complete
MAKDKKQSLPKEETVENTDTPKTPEEQIEAGNKQLEQLTVNDLIVIKNVFDVCTSRGAFKADEMATVGPVYNKLASFLTTIMPPKQPEVDTAEPATGEETQGES